jgi:formylglycine-generating enzyme required for sulfatase activity
MAIKENLSLLSKYQMKVLYIKCSEGATHEEIARKLGRDVNTIQYHMTKIYKILGISAPGKSKEQMDSELKNEICPLVRQMFHSLDDINVWAPDLRNGQAAAAEAKKDEEGIEPPGEEPRPPYQPPASVERILEQASPPQIMQPPPPPRPGIRWRRVFGVGIILIILALILFWPRISLFVSVILRGAAFTPAPAIDTQTPLPPAEAVNPTQVPVILPSILPTQTLTAILSPTPFQIITKVAAKDGMTLLFIPAGEFKMGSSRVEDPLTLAEETPQHSVSLDAYWIDQTEVTNRQYAACVADNACTKPQSGGSLSHNDYYQNSKFSGYPVIFVTWGQASAYCAWAGRRLPSEAEWEKAARGVDGRIYPWGNLFDGTQANYCDINCVDGWKDSHYDDGYTDTSPVGEYPGGASVYGAFDMAGNVYEWVADWYGPYSRTSQANPAGPASGQEHMIRGGSWGDDLAHVRTAVRSHIGDMNYAANFIGFRCVQ